MFKSIAQRLLDRATRTPPPSEPLANPLNLSDDQIAALADLLSHPSWTIFQQALDRVVKLHSETLLASRDSALLNETRGYILGLIQVGTLVDEITAKTQEVHERNLRLANAGSGDAARRHLSLLNTSAFIDPSR